MPVTIPSVDWVDSFSQDVSIAAGWWAKEISGAWSSRRAQALSLLRTRPSYRASSIWWAEALSSAQRRWELEGAALVKAVLQQSALDKADTYCSPNKQFQLLELVMPGIRPARN